MSMDAKYRTYYAQLVEKSQNFGEALRSKDERENTLLHTVLLEECKMENQEKTEHRAFLVQCAERFVRNGASVNAQNIEGTTPLMLALGQRLLGQLVTGNHFVLLSQEVHGEIHAIKLTARHR